MVNITKSERARMSTRLQGTRIVSIGLVAIWIVAMLFSAQPAALIQAANQIELIGPTGSESFGANITVLPNGNIVVADPFYDDYTGAVYLYNGANGAVISTLTGNVPDDKVGSKPVVVLNDGNFVVSSPSWANGTALQAGAVTWCSAVSGCVGQVSPANSLVGSGTNDMIGSTYFTPETPGILALDNGSYVVRSPHWANGSQVEAGAVTWCPAEGGCIGTISSMNSLVGSYSWSRVGFVITVLSDGDYVANNMFWSSDTTAEPGAVTWCDNLGSCNGQAVSAANSLVGSQQYDMAGYGGVVAFNNGSYVVDSPDWNNGAAGDAGAVTWCDGSGGCNGQAISTANSLVGSSSGDLIGNYREPGGNQLLLGLEVLDNGSYVVRSSYWQNGAAGDAGAVTWCDGSGGCNGQAVSVANSLVGTDSDEELGIYDIVKLANGNFLVLNWPYGIASCNATVGCHGEMPIPDPLMRYSSLTALTNGGYVAVFRDNQNKTLVKWCNDEDSCALPWTSENSLTVDFSISWSPVYVIPLENGSYAVGVPGWDLPGVEDVGLVTWCGANGACNGQTANAANSLVGSLMYDGIGGQVLALKGDGYVVVSPGWDKGAVQNVGAVTLCDDQGGCNGKLVTEANSLVGASVDDYTGSDGISQDPVQALQNGGYLVPSFQWHSGGVAVGAITLCNATGNCTGQVVSAANSLVGSSDQDLKKCYHTQLVDGNEVISCPWWDHGLEQDAGAVTWCSATDGCNGVVSPAKSLVGNQAGDEVGLRSFTDYDGNGVVALEDGSYVVVSSYRDNGVIDGAGAITWCKNPFEDCTGEISPDNSVLGQVANGGIDMNFTYDSPYLQLAVGQPDDNKVTLFRMGNNYPIFIPRVSR